VGETRIIRLLGRLREFVEAVERLDARHDGRVERVERLGLGHFNRRACAAAFPASALPRLGPTSLGPAFFGNYGGARPT
jgi:hypothetical protein